MTHSRAFESCETRHARPRGPSPNPSNPREEASDARHLLTRASRPPLPSSRDLYFTNLSPNDVVKKKYLYPKKLKKKKTNNNHDEPCASTFQALCILPGAQGHKGLSLTYQFTGSGMVLFWFYFAQRRGDEAAPAPEPRCGLGPSHAVGVCSSASPEQGRGFAGRVWHWRCGTGCSATAGLAFWGGTRRGGRRGPQFQVEKRQPRGCAGVVQGRVAGHRGAGGGQKGR